MTSTVSQEGSLNRSKTACLVAAFATLAVAAPAAAQKPEAKAPKANDHAKGDAAAKPRKKDATAPAGACPDRVFGKVFSAFHDRALYTLAPDGDFEAAAEGWTL